MQVTRKTSVYTLTVAGDQALLDHMVGQCPAQVTRSDCADGQALLSFRTEDDKAALVIAAQLLGDKTWELTTGLTHSKRVVRYPGFPVKRSAAGLQITDPSWAAGCSEVLDLVREERIRQVAEYGMNDAQFDGTGPNARWLLPFTSESAAVIEHTLRQDYEEFKADHGAPDGLPTWLHLVREEVAEAFCEEDPARLAAELVQVAALCVSWVEQLRKRGAKPLPS